MTWPFPHSKLNGRGRTRLVADRIFFPIPYHIRRPFFYTIAVFSFALRLDMTRRILTLSEFRSVQSISLDTRFHESCPEENYGR